jgi:manganese transport protein
MLLHVEEDVTSVMFGAQSSTAEIQEGRDYLEALVSELRGQSVEVDVLVSHGRVPAQEIARAAIEQNADLIVMASHGHRGIKDLIFGTTINSVRHHVKTPMLIVRDSSPRQ